MARTIVSGNSRESRCRSSPVLARRRHWLGQFSGAHSIGVDSKGSIYVGETYEGKRIQRFVKNGMGPAKLPYPPPGTPTTGGGRPPRKGGGPGAGEFNASHGQQFVVSASLLVSVAASHCRLTIPGEVVEDSGCRRQPSLRMRRPVRRRANEQ